jgi:hypothetical protein
VAVDAFEIQDGNPASYRFQITGDPEEDVLLLLGAINRKVRRGLSVKHLRNDESGLQIGLPF